MSFAARMAAADSTIIERCSAATMTVGVGATFPVIFNEAGQEVQVFDGGVMSTGPLAIAKSADLAANAVGNGVAVTINDPDMAIVDADYVVASVKPDGAGLSIVTLTT